MEAKRPALVSQIPDDILKKYNTIRTRFVNALVVVRRGSCAGCNMNIPPQLYNEMLKTTVLRYCPNCQRLIYVEREAPAVAPAAVNGD